MLVSGSIPSFLNGVSQQPPAVRLPSQASEQTNAIASPTDGLGKRPPTQHLAKLLDYSTEFPLVHFYDRDGVERYIVSVQQASEGHHRVSVHDLNGVEYPVVAKLQDYGYLECDKPLYDLSALTIADTTFIVNKTIEVAMLPDTTTEYQFGAIVWIKAGNYNTNYTVKVHGTSFVHATPDGSDAAQGEEIKTDIIAKRLYEQIEFSSATPSSTWKVIHPENSSVIWIARNDHAKFTIEATDSQSGKSISVIGDSVQKFSDLPTYGHGNHFIKVKGDPGTSADDYWVKFDLDDQTTDIGHGVWSETIAPGTPYIIDPRTLPHQLVRMQDDESGANSGTPFGIYFEFKSVAYGERTVGDESTSPDPSFVGQKIQDVFLHRGRLGFLAGTNIVLSAVNDFLRFFRETVTDVLDSDPIDGEAATKDVVYLRHAVPFAEELLLFGDKTQEILTGGDLLTAKTFSIKQATTFEAERYCRPILVENMVYFPFQNGQYSGIREYYVQDQNATKDSDDVTKHVPRYIQGRVHKLTASTTNNTLVVLADGDPNSLWVYQWLWNGNEKVQSAWGKWTFGPQAKVRGAEFIGSDLYLVMERSCGQYLEKMELSSRADDGVNYVTHLDRRITDEQSASIWYNRRRDETSFELPFRPDVTPILATRYDAADPDWKPAVIHLGRIDVKQPEEEVPTPETNPTVTIVATDPQAAENGPDHGTFTIYRTGEVDEDLDVTVAYSGTATYTTDYTRSPSGTTITIPAGSSSVSIDIIPVDDGTVEDTETVICGIQSDADYIVGDPSTDVVYIEDNDEDPPEGTDTPCTPGDWPDGTEMGSYPATIYINEAEIGPITDPSLYAPGEVGLPYVDPGGSDAWDRGLDKDTGGGSFNFFPAGSDGRAWGGKIVYSVDLASSCNVDTHTVDWHLIVRMLKNDPIIGPTPKTIFEGDRSNGSGDDYGGIYINTLPDEFNFPRTLTIADIIGDPPPPPFTLIATAVSSSQINLSWSFSGTPAATGFKIERSYDGTTNWTQIGTTIGGVTTFQSKGLTAGTTYYYRVRSYNASGDSAYSNVAHDTTFGAVPNDVTLQVTLKSTGESVSNIQCGQKDNYWTVDGQSAKVHPVTTPAWTPVSLPARWVSYDFYTDETADPGTTRDYTTTAYVSGDINLTTLAVPGSLACDNEVDDVLVNGHSLGLSYSSSGSLTSFTLPAGTGFWVHGNNTITFKVTTTAGTSATGLIVKWGKPTATSSPGLADAVDEMPEIAERTVISELPAAEVVSVDPCKATYSFVTPGNLTGKNVYIGQLYEMRYRLSPINVQTQSQSGGVLSITGGRLQLRNCQVTFSNTGYFRAEVTPFYRETSVHAYAGRTLGTPTTRVGEVPNGTGSHRFIIGSKNDQVDIDLVNDSILPSWFVSAEWQGFYTNNAKRI